MNFLKFMSPAALLALLPMILASVGDAMKRKDIDEIGADDAFGNVLIALAPALSAFQSKNDLKFKKALEAVYQTLGNYLGKNTEVNKLNLKGE